MAGRRRILAVIGIAGAVTLAGPAVTTAAEGEPHVIAVPGSAAPGAAITVSGALACPDMLPGDEILLSLHHEDDDHLLSSNLGSAPYADDGTFVLQTAVPTTMADLITRTDVATPAGVHRLLASCSRADDTPPTVEGTLTVLPGGGPTTTSTTTTTTTTTTSSTTTSTVPDTIPSEPTTPTTTPPAGFVPPASPPGDAEPFARPPAGPIAAGERVLVDEVGFAPGETVHVVLHSDPVLLGTATADAAGRVRTTVVVPRSTAPGRHTLVLYGTDLVRSVPLDVVAPAAGPPSPTTTERPIASGVATSADELPRTGTSTAMLAITGLGALAGGAGLLHLRRRLALHAG